MKCWGKEMVIKMAKRSHTDKVHTLGQLQALYKTVISLQKEIKKLEAVRREDDNQESKSQLKGNN